MGDNAAAPRSSAACNSPPTTQASRTIARVCSLGERDLETTLMIERISTSSPCRRPTDPYLETLTMRWQ